MYQVITIGSALVDIFVHSNIFKIEPTNEGDLLCQVYGGKYELDSFKVYTGGGASNSAISYARLGFKTAIICETGRDYFETIVLKELVDEGVETNFVIKEKKEQTGGSVILVGSDGRRTIMVHRGAAAMLDVYDIPGYWLSKTNWVHLSSIGGQLETLKKILMLIKRSDTKLTWNPGNSELKLLKSGQINIEDISCKLFFLNKQEWFLVQSIQKQLIKQIETIVVTDGSNGGQVYHQGKHMLTYKSSKKKAIDETGAGDAFASGFTSAIMLGNPIEEAVNWGKINAQSVISYFGAKPGLLTRDKIEKELT